MLTSAHEVPATLASKPMLTRLLLSPVFHHDWQWWLRNGRPIKAHSVYPLRFGMHWYPVTDDEVMSLGIPTEDDGWFYATDLFEVVASLTEGGVA